MLERKTLRRPRPVRAAPSGGIKVGFATPQVLVIPRSASRLATSPAPPPLPATTGARSSPGLRSIITAELSPQMIARSLATPSLLARIVMSAKIVHDKDVSAPKHGQQLGLGPVDEAILVGHLEHRGQNNPARDANGAEQGEVLAPVHRDAVHEFFAALNPRVAAAHGHVDPRLVEKDQPLEGNPPDLLQEGVSLLDNVGPQTIQRPSARFSQRTHTNATLAGYSTRARAGCAACHD
ncbi:MAG TPA: hypothetical protein VFP84_13350 [Kofleriaceae bacterium]|nr:hypothetical protein [Kofleriaceae bacterium]